MVTPRDRVRHGLIAMAMSLVVAGSTERAGAQAVIRGPYLQSGSDTAIVIRWRTDIAVDSVVRFGSTVGSLMRQATVASVGIDHEVTLSGLIPDTKYFYSVGTSAQTLVGDDADHFFVTSPTPGTAKSTRIWVLGDSGAANLNAEKVRDGYYAFTGARHTDLWLMLGDNAYLSGLDAEYQKAVFDMYPEMLRKSVLWPTLGNHDGIAADSATQTGPYYDIFTLPRSGEVGGLPSGTEAYYSFDYGNIHFVCLESYETSRKKSGAMLKWLRHDLAMNTREWLIAYWHHPPYSKGSHDSDKELPLIEMRENAVPILEAGGVDLVLSGHSHAYERSYLINGHHGPSQTFNSTHKLDGGDGRATGDGVYRKDYERRNGAVYVVAGSSSFVVSGPLDHPIMRVSLKALGSVVIDVNGPRMDVKFLDETGQFATTDHLSIVKGAAKPTARFVASSTSGNAPVAVQFTDESTMRPVSWLWTFGDGTSSTEQNPFHVYRRIGKYDVKLRVENAQGADEVTKVEFIDVANPYPVQVFELSRDPNFLTQDFIFRPFDTMYMRLSTGAIDPDRPKIARWEVRPSSGSPIVNVLTNNLDYTYTAEAKVSSLFPSLQTAFWVWAAHVEDQSGKRFLPKRRIHFLAYGHTPPQWVNKRF